MSEERPAPDMQEDWSPDSFPTSARPVFRAVAILVLIISLLCAIVYYTSEHPEKDAEIKKKQQVQSNLMGEE